MILGSGAASLNRSSQRRRALCPRNRSRRSSPRPPLPTTIRSSCSQKRAACIARRMWGNAGPCCAGALPMNAFATLSLAISPDFANDHMLFTGGYIGDGWGEGVMRSTDGGDTWQPMWNNLTYLRVYQVALSPTYAADRTLLAYAHYTRLTPWETGVAVQRSTDQGVTWSLALTATDETKVSTATTLLGTPAALPLPLRITANGQQVETTVDQGQSWQPLALKIPAGALITQIVPAPGYPADGTIYILSDYEVSRRHLQ